MPAKIIDGKKFAAQVRGKVAKHVLALKKDHNLTPGLAVILIGQDPASEIYVRNKKFQTLEVGMNSFEHNLDENVSKEVLFKLIDELNNDKNVHGILCQFPVPAHLKEEEIVARLDPAKDVDGLHILNAGRLASGQEAMAPCTPLGCLTMLREQHGSLSGLNAVIIGRSNLVGKPMAQLLLRDSATVTIVHSRTKNIKAICKQADILVAAVGCAQMVNSDWIKPNATVIDVGINRLDAPEKGDGKSRLVGDVDFTSASSIAGAITPVPGGVGPMTIACLLANTLTACCRLNDLPEIS